MNQDEPFQKNIIKAHFSNKKSQMITLFAYFFGSVAKDAVLRPKGSRENG